MDLTKVGVRNELNWAKQDLKVCVCEHGVVTVDHVDVKKMSRVSSIRRTSFRVTHSCM